LTRSPKSIAGRNSVDFSSKNVNIDKGWRCFYAVNQATTTAAANIDFRFTIEIGNRKHILGLG